MKSEAEIARDLLLYRSQVAPVVERTKAFCLAVGGIWVASCVGLNVLFSVKPLFNEYDPDMLEKLRYDDKVAGVAASESNGIPTVSFTAQKDACWTHNLSHHFCLSPLEVLQF